LIKPAIAGHTYVFIDIFSPKLPKIMSFSFLIRRTKMRGEIYINDPLRTSPIIITGQLKPINIPMKPETLQIAHTSRASIPLQLPQLNSYRIKRSVGCDKLEKSQSLTNWHTNNPIQKQLAPKKLAINAAIPRSHHRPPIASCARAQT
jgi:hypothetical protein